MFDSPFGIHAHLTRTKKNWHKALHTDDATRIKIIRRNEHDGKNKSTGNENVYQYINLFP